MVKRKYSKSLICVCEYVKGGKKHANALKCKCEDYSTGKIKKKSFSDISLLENK